MNKLLFTDLQLLETIQKEYANIYLKNINDYKTGLQSLALLFQLLHYL